MAAWTYLSTSFRSLARRSPALLLRPQTHRQMGARRGLRRSFKATLGHGSPRFQHVRYLDARIFLHRGWWLRQLPGCKASDLLWIALHSDSSIRERTAPRLGRNTGLSSTRSQGFLGPTS